MKYLKNILPKTKVHTNNIKIQLSIRALYNSNFIILYSLKHPLFSWMLLHKIQCRLFSSGSFACPMGESRILFTTCVSAKWQNIGSGSIKCQESES